MRLGRMRLSAISSSRNMITSRSIVKLEKEHMQHVGGVDLSEIELLKLVLKATEAGKMEWKQVSPDHIEADIDSYLYIIE